MRQKPKLPTHVRDGLRKARNELMKIEDDMSSLFPNVRMRIIKMRAELGNILFDDEEGNCT